MSVMLFSLSRNISYATDTQSLGSDIDILILIERPFKSHFIKKLNKIVKKDFPQLRRKLDCKVLTKSEVRQTKSVNYLFLLSAFQNSIPITNSTFYLNFSPLKLRDSLIDLESQLHSIQEDINIKRNYDVATFSLFSVTKSLYYLNGLIRPDQKRKTPKKVLGKYFYQLSIVYEALTRKGILDSINMPLRRRGQKSGKFRDLEGTLRRVMNYFEETTTSFNEWFDRQELM